MSARDIRDCIKVLVVLNVLFWTGAALASCEEPMGPPAPRSLRSYTAERSAEAAWPWYAAAWSVDVGTTALAFARADNPRETNMLVGDRPVVASALKAAFGYGAWRFEVAMARRDLHWLGKLGRWLFVGVSFAAGGVNVSVAF